MRLLMIEGVAPGVYAVEQALQSVLEDRAEVEVERFPDDVAEPGITGGACAHSMSWVAKPIVRSVLSGHSASGSTLGTIADAVLRFFAVHTWPDTEDLPGPAPGARPG